MPLYSFSNLNHLEERFATFTRAFEDDEAAIAYARREPPLYPLEVHRDGRRLALVPVPPWRMEDWLRRAIA